MGYVTVQKLCEKYGTSTKAAEAFLSGQMNDDDDLVAAFNRLSTTAFVIASHAILRDKLDEIKRCIVIHGCS